MENHTSNNIFHCSKHWTLLCTIGMFPRISVTLHIQVLFSIDDYGYFRVKICSIQPHNQLSVISSPTLVEPVSVPKDIASPKSMFCDTSSILNLLRVWWVEPAWQSLTWGASTSAAQDLSFPGSAAVSRYGSGGMGAGAAYTSSTNSQSFGKELWSEGCP